MSAAVHAATPPYAPVTQNQTFLNQAEIDAALRNKNSVATRGFRQELYVHRACVPLDTIDFETLSPTTLDPMTVGECQGMCGV